MKILIEESVLRQALETFTHCYAETDRRINERAKILVELRTALDAAEKVEEQLATVTKERDELKQDAQLWAEFGDEVGAEQLAALTKERELCAEVCENLRVQHGNGDPDGDECAAAIRSMK